MFSCDCCIQSNVFVSLLYYTKVLLQSFDVFMHSLCKVILKQKKIQELSEIFSIIWMCFANCLFIERTIKKMGEIMYLSFYIKRGAAKIKVLPGCQTHSKW